MMLQSNKEIHKNHLQLCYICEKLFGNKLSLQVHINWTHIGTFEEDEERSEAMQEQYP